MKVKPSRCFFYALCSGWTFYSCNNKELYCKKWYSKNLQTKQKQKQHLDQILSQGQSLILIFGLLWPLTPAPIKIRLCLLNNIWSKICFVSDFVPLIRFEVWSIFYDKKSDSIMKVRGLSNVLGETFIFHSTLRYSPVIHHQTQLSHQWKSDPENCRWNKMDHKSEASNRPKIPIYWFLVLPWVILHWAAGLTPIEKKKNRAEGGLNSG